ncbi:hypothetical protein J6590_052609 [Homalodisca vitripennis]|nr:hypothetical protein J6590_052609 [Homalodisca vitripennis]
MRPAAAQEEEVIGDDTNLSGGVINDSQNEHEGSQSHERLPDADDVTITLTGKQTSSFYHERPKQFKRKVMEKLINLEERKVTEYERRKRDHLLDADYHFLTSLLPSLKTVKEERKLSVKRKLMNVLFEEEQMCMHRPSTSSSASNYSSRPLSVSSNPLPNSPCTAMETECSNMRVVASNVTTPTRASKFLRACATKCSRTRATNVTAPYDGVVEGAYPVMNLAILKHAEPYAGSIYDVALDKTVVHILLQLKCCFINITAKKNAAFCRWTQRGVWLRKLQDPITLLATYLYTKKQDANTILYWLNEWEKKGASYPKEINVDNSPALKSAVERSYDHSRNKERRRLKYFYLRCLGLLIKSKSLADFQEVLRDFLIMASASHEGLSTPSTVEKLAILSKKIKGDESKIYRRLRTTGLTDREVNIDFYGGYPARLRSLAGSVADFYVLFSFELRNFE